MFSDHATVRAYWKNKDVVYHSQRWHLVNFLLMEEVSRVQTDSIIKAFFEINVGTADYMIVWDTFKA